MFLVKFPLNPYEGQIHPENPDPGAVLHRYDSTLGAWVRLPPDEILDADLIKIGTLDPARLANSGVTAGIYGAADTVPVITVDSKGRIVDAANESILIPQTSVTNLVVDLAAKAPLSSPSFTGIPTAPTASVNTDTTQLATTSFVQNQIDYRFVRNIIIVPALDIDCSLGNYYTKTIGADSTFTFSNAPSDVAYAFTLELTHNSGNVTWPTSVKWRKDTAPTLTTGKTHLFVFVTDNGGSRWRGSELVDYVN